MRRLFALLLAIAFVFAGCGAPPENREVATSVSVISSFGEGDGRYAVYNQLLTEFTQESGITVNDDSEMSTETWKNDTIAKIKSKDCPDVVFFFSGANAQEILDYVVNLDTIQEIYPNYASNMNLSALSNLAAADGHCYAVPVTGYWEAMFVNTDLFESNNIKIPESWDELLAACTAFRAKGINPIAVSLGEVPHYWFEYLIYNHSGPAAHLDSIPSDVDNLSDSWVNGLNYFPELYDIGAFPPDTNHITNNEAVDLFNGKQAAMLIDGSWTVGSIINHDTVRLINFPSVTGGARQNTDMIGGFSMGFYITKAAWDSPSRRAAAVRFVEHMTSDDAVLRFNADGASALPISIALPEISDPLIKSIADVNNRATAYVGAVQDTLTPAARTWLFEQIPSIATKRSTVEDVLRELVYKNAG